MIGDELPLEVPEAFAIEVDKPVEGLAGVVGRITTVPGFTLPNPISFKLDSKDGTYTAEQNVPGIGLFGSSLYGYGNSPREAAYDMFVIMTETRQDYVAAPEKFHPSVKESGEFLRKLFEPG